jgi:hypothetical protein
MFNNDSKFDFDLAKGIENEKSVAAFLGMSKDKFECKSERDYWKKTGNLCIELESYGKKSGLNGTHAKYWVHSFYDGDDLVGITVIAVNRLKNIVKRGNYKEVMLGDNKASKCVLIKMSEYLNQWRLNEEL